MRRDRQRSPYLSRQERLRRALAKGHLDLLIVSSPINIGYLSGFRGSAGVMALGERDGILWVDPRYTAAAEDEACGAKVVETRDRLLKTAGEWIRRKVRVRVGYDDENLSCREFRELAENAGAKARFEPAGGMVERFRAVKDATEIRLIREACRLTVEVFREIASRIAPGVPETELAAEIEYLMRRRGAEGPAFETIVASGARSALPHARASAKLLQNKDLVVIDFGAILHGYVSDFTRTCFLGRPGERVKRAYDAVREAHGAALKRLRPGAKAREADSAARQALKRRGLAKHFAHSTGHGVGLEIHEAPRLAHTADDVLETGSVVTVEPGVYFEGWGGIRIEDTVLVGRDGPEILTPASKDDWVIN